jgi:hypothetical protein
MGEHGKCHRGAWKKFQGMNPMHENGVKAYIKVAKEGAYDLKAFTAMT